MWFQLGHSVIAKFMLLSITVTTEKKYQGVSECVRFNPTGHIIFHLGDES